MAYYQEENNLIADNGKPIAILLGLENTDSEELSLQSSSQFWEMISDRRKRSTIPLSVVESQLHDQE
jgi:hypothetical protein